MMQLQNAEMGMFTAEGELAAVNPSDAFSRFREIGEFDEDHFVVLNPHEPSWNGTSTRTLPFLNRPSILRHGPIPIVQFDAKAIL
jgi:hypothetical protein